VKEKNRNRRERTSLRTSVQLNCTHTFRSATAILEDTN